MSANPAPDLVRWVKEGEHLFGLVLQTLHRSREVEAKAEILARENDRLRAEVQDLEAQRLDTIETLKTFAEHVTRLASAAIQRLGTPGPVRGHPAPPSPGHLTNHAGETQIL